ncbi:MAG TPA: STM3941 family protein [Streptosporangiaceae bacterium]|nr:STM3941 family protein [Streptosporangiaceae bacterium]
MSVPSSEDLVIPADRQQQRTLAGMSALFTAFGAALLYYSTTKGGFAAAGWLVAGIVIAGFFGLTSSILLLRLLRARGPALVLTSDGLTASASALGSPGFISWSEIEDVRASPRWVALRLRDPSPVLTRQPGWRRWLLRWHAKRMGGHVFIPCTAVPVQPEELLRLIHERRSRSAP